MASRTTPRVVLFDLDGDDYLERSGWVRPDDGFLVADLNSNGTIDDVSEMFGNASTPGFVALVLPLLPAHRAVSRDPLLTYHHHSHIYIRGGDGDDSFCGGSHVRRMGDGRHLDPPERRLGKPEAPVEERHTGSFLLLLRFLRSCVVRL